MKSIRLLGLALLAIFALGAVAAVSASAEAGFLPTPTTKPTTALPLGGVSTLTPKGGESIVCGKLDTGLITFSNDKHAKGSLHWLECKLKNLGFSAQSLGNKAGEILVTNLLFLICLDPKNAKGELIDNFGVAAEIESSVHLEVPTVGQLILVKGTALGAILTVGPAKLWLMEFKGSGGEQTVTECLEGGNKKTHTLESEENENGKPVKASENVEGGLLQFNEEVELMDS